VRLVSYDGQGSGRVGSGIALVGFKDGGGSGTTYSTAAITTPAAADNVGGITPTEASAYCDANDTTNATVDIQFTFTR
jgi:hypothetical protein